MAADHYAPEAVFAREICFFVNCLAPVLQQPRTRAGSLPPSCSEALQVLQADILCHLNQTPSQRACRDFTDKAGLLIFVFGDYAFGVEDLCMQLYQHCRSTELALVVARSRKLLIQSSLATSRYVELRFEPIAAIDRLRGLDFDIAYSFRVGDTFQQVMWSRVVAVCDRAAARREGIEELTNLMGPLSI